MQVTPPIQLALKGMYRPMLKLIDTLLDKVTMYRLLLYYLIALLVISLGVSHFGHLGFSPAAIIFSSLLLVAVCWVSNKILAWLFNAPTNTESPHLTALILALIVTPTTTVHGVLFLMLVGIIAMASKYVLTINKTHIFNPAAIAVVITGFVMNQTASWWVGDPSMFPYVLIGGLLLVRKIRRAEMVITFIAVALTATALYAVINDNNIYTYLERTVTGSALLFMAFVMLTEPLTSPATVRKQRWYAALAGLLFPPQIHLGSIYSTPQLDLVISNIFSYIVSPPVKLFPRLINKETLSPSILNFTFRPEKKLRYVPGQYMEWTLPHSQGDSRGDRRYLTLASSPTEPDLMLGVKFYPKGSSYKKSMLAMTAATQISAGQLGGDFVLPKDPNTKLVLIAGGIGITPYRSMLKYLIDKNEPRDITLMYAAHTPDEFVYQNIFHEAAQKLGAKVIYTVTDDSVPTEDWSGHRGLITTEMIKSQVPDYKKRTFYISGPQPMVQAMKDILKHDLAVPGSYIKTDFFPGYA